jgi:hypothetical protein
MRHEGRDRDEYRDGRMRGHRGRRRSPVESIVAGSVFVAVFGVLWFTTKEWWWVFPMAFAGVLPLVEGFRRLLGSKQENRIGSQARESESEKEILRAARDSGGRLTATGAALGTSLSVAEAQALLEQMTRQGHAVMRVTNEGIIEFEFPEFLPRSDTGRLV